MRLGLGSRSCTTVSDGAPLFLVRLYLLLACTSRTPVRDTPEVWKLFPFIIRDWYCRKNAWITSSRNSNTEIARVKSSMGAFRDCIWQENRQQCKSHFRCSHLRISGLIARMKRCQSQERIGKDFLPIRSWEDLPHPFNPSGFIVSRFPGLPKLLPSAVHLVGLHLRDIPQPEYFSPEAMPVLIALSTLTNLRDLSLCFSPPRSCSDRTSLRPPLLAWSDLPFLPH